MFGTRTLDGFSADPRADEAAMRAATAHYWHPVGTCAIGPDPAAAPSSTPPDGCTAAIFWDVDASIIPVIPRATTNLPVVALAEHVTRLMRDAV
ncbi:GMC oxidoreductase [Nonomuraea sp. NPDC049152]|uniref:GMC oxidoreductase n=1 Tax=Nonomuraea sp. NPDC049152 TaxID=3154350 RepID=UPI0033C57501